MKKNLLTAATLAASLSSAQAVVLISDSTGNGGFNYDVTGTPTAGISITDNFSRDRGFVPTPNINAGFDFDGWSVRRQAYNGGNNAFGLDGNFGFAAGESGTGTGQTGQFFTNGNSNTRVRLESTAKTQAIAVGDIINVGFLLGTDAASGGATATVELVFDGGLGTESVVSLGAQTGGSAVNDATTNLVSLTHTSTGAFTTVALRFDQVGPTGASTRSLIDDAFLEVVPEPSSSLLAGLGILGLAARRRR